MVIEISLIPKEDNTYRVRATSFSPKITIEDTVDDINKVGEFVNTVVANAKEAGKLDFIKHECAVDKSKVTGSVDDKILPQKDGGLFSSRAYTFLLRKIGASTIRDVLSWNPFELRRRKMGSVATYNEIVDILVNYYGQDEEYWRDFKPQPHFADRIENTPLSQHIISILQTEGNIRTVKDLIHKTPHEIQALSDIGRYKYNEIVDFLVKYYGESREKWSV